MDAGASDWKMGSERRPASRLEVEAIVDLIGQEDQDTKDGKETPPGLSAMHQTHPFLDVLDLGPGGPGSAGRAWDYSRMDDEEA